jgi:antitoxin MazE
LDQERAKGVSLVTTATVRKWGNSLAIRLPREVVSRLNFEDGAQLEMLVSDNREVILRPMFPAADDQENLRKHFLALRAKCKPGMGNHEEVFSEPIGDEIV